MSFEMKNDYHSFSSLSVSNFEIFMALLENSNMIMAIIRHRSENADYIT